MTDDPFATLAPLSDRVAAPSSNKAPAMGAAIAARPVSVAAWSGQPVPERPWLLPGWLPARVPVLFSGNGGDGKSLLAAQLALAVATGRPFLGMDVPRGRVLIYSCEDDQDELHRRFDAIAKPEGVDLCDAEGVHVVSLVGQDAVLAVSDRGTGTMKATDRLRELERFVQTIEPTLVIIDAAADVFGGLEIDRAQVRAFIGMLRRLTSEYDLTILLLAHPSVEGMRSGTGLSGNTAWSNSVRARWVLDRPKVSGEDADPDLRRLRVAKSNYGPLGAEIMLRYAEGRFVAEGSTGRVDRAAAASKAERVFLKLLAQFNRQERYVSPSHCSTYAPKVFAEHPDAETVSKRDFGAAMNALLSAGKIIVAKHGNGNSKRTHLEVAP